MELNNKETNVVSRIQERIIAIEGGDVEARIAETLLNESVKTEVEKTSDENLSDTRNSKMDFIIADGPMKNLHINHINANANREKN